MTRLKDINWPHTKLQWFILLAPLIIILLYVLIASYRLRFPGVQYDEALYVNAALGGVDQTTFLTKTFHGLPVLLMPYIGALKSYIFFPVFALFGVSAITMRLPAILLSAVGLYILYRLLRDQISVWASLCILALTALDASYIMFTRLDNGPVVLDFLLKIVGIFLLLRFLRSQRLWPLAGFWVIMLLGVFNKLNFIWDVNALVGGFVLIYGLGLWRKIKRGELWWIVSLSTAGYLFCVGYYLYISKAYHLPNSLGFVGWNTIKNNLVPVITGSWFYNYALSPSKIGTTWIFWFMLTMITAGILCLLKLCKNHKAFNIRLVQFFGFIVVSLFLLLAQIFMTRQATAGWHYFSVYPLFETAFVLSLFLLARTVWPKQQQLVTFSVVAIVGACCFYQLYIYRFYAAAYNKPANSVIWSAAIYSLADFTRSHPKAQFISLDWGTQTQLTGFDPVKYKFYEVLGPIVVDNSAQNDHDFQIYITSKPGAYYITHTPGKAIFPDTSKQFFALAQEHGYQPQLVKTITDGAQPIFELYQLHHQQ